MLPLLFVHSCGVWSFLYLVPSLFLFFKHLEGNLRVINVGNSPEPYQATSCMVSINNSAVFGFLLIFIWGITAVDFQWTVRHILSQSFQPKGCFVTRITFFKVRN